MKTSFVYLLAALAAAGVPVIGVSIGIKDDKSTWRVDFAEDVTDEQKTQAAGIVAAFDGTVPEPLGPTAKADLWRRASDDERLIVAGKRQVDQARETRRLARSEG